MEKRNTRSSSRSKNNSPEHIQKTSDNTGGSQATLNINKGLPTDNTMVPPEGKGKTTEELLNGLATSMDKLQKSITELHAKTDKNSSSIEEIKSETKKNHDDMQKKFDDFQKNDLLLRVEVKKTQTEVQQIKGEVKILMDEKEKLAQEKRSLNIIIQGVPETKGDEKMYETMTWLLTEMECTFPYSLTNGSYRIGQKPKPKGKNKIYPRNIVLKLLTTQQKSEIFGLAKNLKDHDILNGVRFANDYTDDQMLIHKEVQQVYFALRKKESVSVRTRGLSLIIDGKTYSKKDFDDLPHGITLENTSTIETPDGMAFKETHAQQAICTNAISHTRRVDQDHQSITSTTTAWPKNANLTSHFRRK